MKESTHEFDMPVAEAGLMEEYEPGKCPDCGAKVQIHPQRRQQMQ